MKLIINLQPLLAPLTGIGHYTRELTRELVLRQEQQALSGELKGLAGLRIDLLASHHPLLAEAAPGAQPSGAADGRAWQWARRYLRNPVTRFAYRQALSQRLRLHAWQGATSRESLYWEPNFIRLPWPGRSVVTVHDLSHRRFPQYHPRERIDFFNRHLAASLTRASRINVVSQFTADELQALYGVAPERIDIVPPGVAQRFFAVDEAQRTRAVARHDLPPRYCLSVGTLEPRKNLHTLLEAFLAQPLARQRDCPLLLVGMPGWGEQTLSTQARQALRDGRLRRLGYIADADLPALYANATLFAYVSRYEGFGMPVIEAMAAGVPVITADRSATREVAGDAALTVDPEDVDAVRHALEQLQDDNDLAEQLRQAGRKRAEHFSWNRSADALLASFRHALSY